MTMASLLLLQRSSLMQLSLVSHRVSTTHAPYPHHSGQKLCKDSLCSEMSFLLCACSSVFGCYFANALSH